MKLTRSKEAWVFNKVKHYSQLLQISEPTVFLTMAAYNRWKQTQRIYGGQRVGRTECGGVCHRKEGIIVILVTKVPNLDMLDELIRHEMIHYAKPSYNHRSNTFRDRMWKLKQGKVKNGRFIK